MIIISHTLSLSFYCNKCNAVLRSLLLCVYSLLCKWVLLKTNYRVGCVFIQSPLSQVALVIITYDTIATLFYLCSTVSQVLLLCMDIHLCSTVSQVVLWCMDIHLCSTVSQVLLWCRDIHLCSIVSQILLWCMDIHLCSSVSGIAVMQGYPPTICSTVSQILLWCRDIHLPYAAQCLRYCGDAGIST